MKKILPYFLTFILIAVSIFILTLTVKGDKGGSPIAYQTDKSTIVGGPYESSNSTSRYALTEAIVENHSLSFTNVEAKFASPDLVYYHKRFYTIFTPGVSLIGVPFYIIGKLFSVPQLFTYFSVTLTALINVFLIATVARKFHVNRFAAYIGGFIFLFATNSLVYANSYTQHHLTTFLILLGVLNALDERTAVRNILFGFILGASFLVDLPNLVLFTPIALYIIYKHIRIEKSPEVFSFSLRTSIITILIGLLPFISIFAWYNKETTGSYLKSGQTIGRTDYENVFGKKQINNKVLATGKDRSSFFPFQTRLQLQGMNILLVSKERSWFYYCPIVLFGVLGFILLYKGKDLSTEMQGKRGYINMLLSVIGVNIILYSMFGDPWGGWSFGPRYLIPSAAILSIGIGVAVQRLYKNLLFSLLFFLTLVYSVFISVLGVVTTATIPPKQEAIHLINPIPYTYDYNLQLIDKNNINSLVYNIFLRERMPGYTYTFIIFGLIMMLFIVLYTLHNSYERRSNI